MELASGVGQVNAAMNQHQATLQNASASEELAATAEEMSSQAEQLQQLMGFFRMAGQDDIRARAGEREAPRRSRDRARVGGLSRHGHDRPA